VTITIKPGSVDEYVAVDVSPIQPASVPEVPTALRVRVSTGGVVDITFKDADGNPITNFVSDRAITVTVKFTDAEAADAGGANNLVIMKYDENAGSWSKLTTTVDLFNKTLSSQVKTFSLFGVGIPGVAVQPTAAAPTATVAAGLPTATPRTDVVLPATGDVAPGAGAIMGFIVLGLLLVTSGVAIVRRRQVARARS
jgi:LPXTG-motif cell wall-anchored protein